MKKKCDKCLPHARGVRRMLLLVLGWLLVMIVYAAIWAHNTSDVIQFAVDTFFIVGAIIAAAWEEFDPTYRNETNEQQTSTQGEQKDPITR